MAVAIAVLAGGIAVIHGHQPSGSPANGKTAASPASVVMAWYDAINRRDWPQVQLLWPGGEKVSDAQIAQGFAKTRHDYATITATNGADVSVLLLAVETDNKAQIYHADYKTSGTVIIQGSAPDPVDLPLGPAVFSAFSGDWLGSNRTLTISPEGLGIAQFSAQRSCTSNPSPPCDSVSGSQVYPGGAIIFQLTGEKNSQAEGHIVDSSVPGLSGLITITSNPSQDSVALTTEGRAPVAYCGPRARAGLCGSG